MPVRSNSGQCADHPHLEGEQKEAGSSVGACQSGEEMIVS